MPGEEVEEYNVPVEVERDELAKMGYNVDDELVKVEEDDELIPLAEQRA